MGVVGKPRDTALRIHWSGRFRLEPDAAWIPSEAWQYNTRVPIARVFVMRMRMGGVLPVIARDTYARGQGRMLAKALDWFTVADGQGEEFDLGELVTYLNDAVLFAPTLVLGPAAVWSAVDDQAFDIALSDGGRTVTARVFVDARGAPKDFSTTDRFLADLEHPKARPKRTRWTTIDDWQWVAGRPVPTRGRAVWQLERGPYEYADFAIAPDAVAFNVAAQSR
jgi:hypothetical protein